MIKRPLFILLLTALLAAVAAGQSVYTPERGSAERKAILDALRIPVERELKQKVIFTADEFNVLAYWAFVSGQPQAVDGGQPDYAGTRYEEAEGEGAFDNNFFALLKRTNGKWRVVTYAIGCTDVCYLDWAKRFKACEINIAVFGIGISETSDYPDVRIVDYMSLLKINGEWKIVNNIFYTERKAAPAEKKP